jgi:hypothetical protein
VAQTFRRRGGGNDWSLPFYDRILRSGKDPTWYRDALLVKAKMMRSKGDTPAAVVLLEQLISLPPLYEETRGGVVGEGYNLLAWIHHHQLGDDERACALLEIVIASPDLMPLSQGEAYWLYTSILGDEGESERAIEAAEQGLSTLPIRHASQRSWLEAVRAVNRYRLGEIGAEELEALAVALEPANDNASTHIRRALAGEDQR